MEGRSCEPEVSFLSPQMAGGAWGRWPPVGAAMDPCPWPLLVSKSSASCSKKAAWGFGNLHLSASVSSCRPPLTAHAKAHRVWNVIFYHFCNKQAVQAFIAVFLFCSPNTSDHFWAPEWSQGCHTLILTPLTWGSASCPSQDSSSLGASVLQTSQIY